MPTQVYLQNLVTANINSQNGSGQSVPLNVGANTFTDGDGVNRAHALATVDKVLSSTLSQTGLAPATLSNLLYLDTANGFTLMISSSAAATVTVFVTRAGGGAAYQLLSTSGSPISLTFTAGQALALSVLTGAYSVGIMVSATSNIVLEVTGAVGI